LWTFNALNKDREDGQGGLWYLNTIGAEDEVEFELLPTGRRYGWIFGVEAHCGDGRSEADTGRREGMGVGIQCEMHELLVQVDAMECKPALREARD
jgi:hypothetical protein